MTHYQDIDDDPFGGSSIAFKTSYHDSVVEQLGSLKEHALKILDIYDYLATKSIIMEVSKNYDIEEITKLMNDTKLTNDEKKEKKIVTLPMKVEMLRDIVDYLYVLYFRTLDKLAKISDFPRNAEKLLFQINHITDSKVIDGDDKLDIVKLFVQFTQDEEIKQIIDRDNPYLITRTMTLSQSHIDKFFTNNVCMHLKDLLQRLLPYVCKSYVNETCKNGKKNMELEKIPRGAQDLAIYKQLLISLK